VKGVKHTMAHVMEQEQRDDEAAIGRLLGQLVNAWNRGDGAAFGATFVFVKREGEWRITAFQNTRVQPLPAGAQMPPAGG